MPACSPLLQSQKVQVKLLKLPTMIVCLQLSPLPPLLLLLLQHHLLLPLLLLLLQIARKLLLLPLVRDWHLPVGLVS